MSFRTEEKIFLKRSDLIRIKSFIINHNGKRLYPNRKINSIYFDNKNLQSFHDSEDGCVPRKKIRIRNYNDKLEFSLEKKISSVEGKFKKSFEISKRLKENYIKNGLFDPTYGNCYPTIKISYLREYYLLNNIRITLDYDIIYSSVNTKKIIRDIDSLILELKSKSIVNTDFLLNLVPMNRLRCSKYCNGINNIIGIDNTSRYQLNI